MFIKFRIILNNCIQISQKEKLSHRKRPPVDLFVFFPIAHSVLLPFPVSGCIFKLFLDHIIFSLFES